MGLRCVHCGWEMKTLAVHYSPSNVRLLKCGSCNSVADPYVECELMILLIDLILHKEKAYRHLLHNIGLSTSQDFFWKSAIAYLVLELSRSLILYPITEDWNLSGSSFSVITWSRVLIIFLENVIFFSISCYFIRFLVGPSLHVAWWKDISFTILVSSYMKIFMIAMLVWEFPSSVVFIIDMFVLSSNAVAVRVMTGISEKMMTLRCMGLLLAAYTAKMLATHLLLTPHASPWF